MKESRVFDNSDDLPSLPEKDAKADDQAGEAVINERLLPLVDRVLHNDDSTTSMEEYGLPKTEEVLHKVVEAAENNQAIEKLFELSHESKDFLPRSATNTSEASSLGQLLESRSQNYALPHRYTSDNNIKNSERFKRLITGNSLYGHAIRYGFASAILALLTAILAVSLFT